MAKDFAKSFYRSKAWKDCRLAYIARRRLADGGMCESCRERPGYIVHHKEPITAENVNDPGITLNHDLLAYECKECHDRLDGHGVGFRNTPAICAFSETGEVLGILPPYKNNRL